MKKLFYTLILGLVILFNSSCTGKFDEEMEEIEKIVNDTIEVVDTTPVKSIYYIHFTDEVCYDLIKYYFREHKNTYSNKKLIEKIINVDTLFTKKEIKYRVDYYTEALITSEQAKSLEFDESDIKGKPYKVKISCISQLEDTLDIEIAELFQSILEYYYTNNVYYYQINNQANINKFNNYVQYVSKNTNKPLDYIPSYEDMIIYDYAVGYKSYYYFYVTENIPKITRINMSLY